MTAYASADSQDRAACERARVLGFIPYNVPADVKIGDVVMMACSLDRPGTQAAYATSIVEDIREREGYMMVHLVRPHAHVSKIGSCHGGAFFGTERWELELPTFSMRYVRFSRGPSNEPDNRRRDV